MLLMYTQWDTYRNVAADRLDRWTENCVNILILFVTLARKLSILVGIFFLLDVLQIQGKSEGSGRNLGCVQNSGQVFYPGQIISSSSEMIWPVNKE